MHHRVFRRIFTVICTIGFLIQSGYISYDYFGYHTTTKVTMDTKARIRPPTTTFCARYIDLIDRASLRYETGIRILQLPKRTKSKPKKPSRRYSATTIHYRQSHLLTVRDIFDYTPETSDIVKSCLIRDVDNNRGTGNYTRTGCNVIFNVTKFYMQSFMCYNFRLRNATGTFAIEGISHSYSFELATYVVSLPKEFVFSRTIFIMLSPEEYPYVSRSYGAYMRTMLHLGMDYYSNDYLIQNKVTRIRLLPPPFDSMCFMNHDYSSNAECLISKMREKGMDRVPNTEIIRKPYGLRHVLLDDEKNRTMRQLLDDCYRECEHIAKRQKCHYSFSETQVAMAANPDFPDELRLRAMGPHSPIVLITSHPKFGPSEYFIYFFSCAGIWLGISIVHFNPLLLVFILFKKMKRCRKRKIKVSWIKVHPDRVVYFENGRI